MNETLKFEPIGESMTGDMLVSTDGSRVYVDLTTRTQGMEASQIVLLDLKTQKGWYITPYKKPSADGKLGEYTVRNIKGKLQDQISPVAPVEGREFKQEWKGNDYTETNVVLIKYVFRYLCAKHSEAHSKCSGVIRRKHHSLPARGQRGR